MEWYLRIGDEEYGPVGADRLQAWAAEGRLTAEGQIATAPDGPWEPAYQAPETGLDWSVDDGEGNEYGPVHVLAMQEPLAAGEWRPDYEVTNLRTGKTYLLVDVLCAALVEQNGLLREALADTRLQLDELLRITPAKPDQPEEADREATGGSRTEWTRIMQQKDRMERELSRWKGLYEQEQDRTRSQEAELKAVVHRAQQGEEAAHLKCKQLEKRQRQLELELQELRAARIYQTEVDSSEDPDYDILQRSYSELSRNFDGLLEKLRQKSTQLEESIAERDRLEHATRRRMEEIERQLDFERQTAEQARRELLELESTYHALLQSHREMNDQLIRMRSRMAAPMNASESGAPRSRAEPRKHGPGKPRLRLT